MAKDEKTTKAPEPAQASSAPTGRDTQAVEAWAAELDTPGWLFAAAKAKSDWPQGVELTRGQFEAALNDAGNEVAR